MDRGGTTCQEWVCGGAMMGSGLGAAVVGRMGGGAGMVVKFCELV